MTKRVRNIIDAVFLAVLISGTPIAQALAVSVSSEPVPVMFLVNYMDSFNPSGSRGGQELGKDYYPFCRREATDLETVKQEVQAMIDGGFDGIQIWPDYRQTARWMDLLAELKLSKPFFVSPQIAGVAHKFFSTYSNFVAETATFLRDYGNHPCMLKVDGKPVISSWGDVSGYIDDMEKFRADVRAVGGGEFFMLPTIGLGVHEPDLQKLAEVRKQHYDGFNSWRQMCDADLIRTVMSGLAKDPFPVLPVGSLWSGYRNNNRMFSDTYRPYDGAKQLINSLDAGLETGLKWTILVTWNDIHESASFPCWKNIYGTMEITRFYRSIYGTGKSDLPALQTVLAYNTELLLGDSWSFDAVLLPGEQTTVGEIWQAELRLEDVHGNPLLTKDLQTEMSRTDRATYSRNLIAIPDLDDPVFTPYLTVNGETKRLAPVIIRHGRSRLTSPTLIAFDRVIDVSVDFSVETPVITQTGPLALSGRVSANIPVKEIRLADGDDILADISATDGLPEFHLGIDNWTDSSADIRLNLSQGSFSASHIRSNWDEPDVNWAGEVQDLSLNIPATTVGFRPESPVIIISGKTSDPRNTGCVLQFNGKEIQTSLMELGRTPVILKDDNGGELRIRLLETGLAQFDSPHLNETNIPFSAFLSNPERGEPFRTVCAHGLLIDGQAFFSAPLIWYRAEDTNMESIAVPVVQSGMAADDDIQNPGTKTLHVFDSSAVKTVELNPLRIPEYSFDFDEGSGWYVNDPGAYTTRGWGWRNPAGSRKAAWSPPDELDPQWEHADVISGSAMRFGKKSRIGIRSNSGFSGAFTISGWLKPDDISVAGKIYSDTGFSFEMLAGGALSATRDVCSVSGSGCTLKTDLKLQANQWQYVALVYDLTSLRIYIDGQLAAETTAPATLLRSNSTPWFGATSRDKADGFAGIMDEVMLSARPLSASEISSRYADGASRVQ